MPHDDDETVRELLRRRGADDDTVARGFRGLIEAWEKAAGDIDRGWPHGLDRYLDELETRQLLADAWGAASDAERERFRERLESADALARAALGPAPRCVWGAEVALYHGWDPEREWWWFALPRDPDEAFARELEARGLR